MNGGLLSKVEKKRSARDRISSLERRRYIRVVETSSVTFTHGKNVSGQGRLMDLSLRGLRFTSKALLKSGQKIQASFDLGRSIQMDLAAVVRHGHKWKDEEWIYGIEFFIRDFKDLKEHLKLHEFIAEARARQDEMLRRQISKEKP